MNRVRKRIRLRLGRKRLNKARKIGRLLLLIGVLPSLCLSANANVQRLAFIAANDGDKTSELCERGRGLNPQSRFFEHQTHNFLKIKKNFEHQTLDYAAIDFANVSSLSCEHKETAASANIHHSLCPLNSAANRAPPFSVIISQ